ncbi:MAG: hypothetical protein MZW92_34160 [Comamonadaceae bacterium]|nr:hypothetical protein [Comamonadaceae bacterium]
MKIFSRTVRPRPALEPAPSRRALPRRRQLHRVVVLPDSAGRAAGADDAGRGRSAGGDLAALTTVTSVLGGLLGYLIGYLALEAVTPLLHRVGYWEPLRDGARLVRALRLLGDLRGRLHADPLQGVHDRGGRGAHERCCRSRSGPLVGRGARYLLVAGLVRWGGAPIEHHIRRYIDGIGWATLGVAARRLSGLEALTATGSCRRYACAPPSRPRNHRSIGVGRRFMTRPRLFLPLGIQRDDAR